MRFLPLACASACAYALALTTPVSTSAAFLSTTAISSGERQTTNSQAPSPPGPTYTYTSGALNIGTDGRGQGYANDGAVKFALGALPAGATINSAILSFNVTFSQFTIIQSSTETIAISGSATTTAALTVADFGAVTGNAGQLLVPTNIGNTTPTNYSVTVDVTAFLRSFVGTTPAAVEFQLDSQTPYTNTLISSFDDPTAAYRPSLAITYNATVPEPGSMGLVALGVVCLAVRSGRGLRRAA